MYDMKKVRGKELGTPKNLSAVLEYNEWDILSRIGYREHLSISEITRKAVVEYIKNHAEGNDTFVMTKWIADPDFQAVPTIHADREKWINHYKDSNKEDRVKLNIKINDLQKVFKMIEVNENRK